MRRRSGRLQAKDMVKRPYFLFLYTDGSCLRSGVRVERARVEWARSVRLCCSDRLRTFLVGPFLCREWAMDAYYILLQSGAIVEAPVGSRPVREWKD